MTEQPDPPGILPVVILMDADGAYFALPVAIINQLRVPEMYRAELDELFATDVSGFAATWQARSGTNIGLGSVMKQAAGEVIISFAHLNTAAPPAQEDAGEKGVVRRAVETTRIVVLRDEHNLLYAIPFPVVERMRVSGDEAAELARALDEEPDPFSGNRFTGRLLLWSSVDDA